MVLIRWEMSIHEWIKILWILFDSELVTHPRRKWTSLPSWIYLFTENIIKENPSLGPAWFCLFALLRINKSQQWACYPVSLKSSSFRLTVRCIVITVTCPRRGLALNPDELLSGREGDVASFGGGWVDQSISEWAAAPCAAWPTRGFQIHPILLGHWGYRWRHLRALTATTDCMLSRGSCPGAPPPPPLPVPASPHLVFLMVSPQAVATLWATVAGGLLLRFYVGDRQCCSLVKVVSVPHSLGPWQVVSPATVRRLPAIRCHSICGWNKLDLTVCIMAGQWKDSRSASTSCGPRANQLIFQNLSFAQTKNLSEYI